MSILKRSAVMVLLAVFAGMVYAGARTYSPALISYVVEQSLLQKAPPNMHSGDIQERFGTYIDSYQDQDVRMQRLLVISKYLEKVQRLTIEEFDRLLPVETSDNSPTSKLLKLELFHLKDV
jgi:hypothetical protein